MAVPTREQFVEQVIQHVRTKFPLVKIGRADQAFSLRVNGSVASLENLYRLTALRPTESDHHVDRWMVELLRASEGLPDHKADFEELKGRILPMVLSSTTTDMHAGTMITQPLVGNLIVAYAIDHDRTISYIPTGVFEKWKISFDELHETALQNLVVKSDAITAQVAQNDAGEVYLVLFQTMDGYDASRVLLPTLHDRLREFLGSPFVAGIPNRDILLCFRDDEETVERLKDQIGQDYLQMPHQITDQLLLVTRDGLASRE